MTFIYKMSENVSVLKTSTSNSSSTHNSSDGTTSPWWEESLFGDWSCGEPLIRQHLLIDFTPMEDQDTEYVQKKCCDFWTLVANSPELQGLKTLPDIKNKSQDGQSVKKTRSTTSSSMYRDIERTAISMLEIAGEKGMVEGAFEALMPASCSATSREYRENEPTGAEAKARETELKIPPACKCKVKSCKRGKVRHIQHSLPETRRLNHTMGEWGQTHPKSMDPPGRTPILSHSLMQRNIL